MKKLFVLASVAIVGALLMGGFTNDLMAARNFSGTWISPYPQGNTLRDVWGSSGTDVFAVGDVGTIIHYDGFAWTSMNSGTTENLQAVWGFSGVGWNGIILHYDGSSWTEMESPATEYLSGLWGDSSSDVFAVGRFGIFHFDGTSWTRMIEKDYTIFCVWGVSGDDVYAVSLGEGKVFHYDGNSWSQVEESLDLWSSSNAIGGRSNSDIYAVGTGEFSFFNMHHYDGTDWSGVDCGTLNGLHDVWVSSGKDVFAVGQNGVITHYDGDVDKWIVNNTGSAILYGVWGSSKDDVFVVGEMGVIYHYNGDSWHLMSSENPYLMDMYAVWGTSADNVYVSGSFGEILHYDGNDTILAHQENDRNIYFWDIWGASESDIFAVGSDNHSVNGLIVHYDGTSWETLLSDNVDGFNSVWGSAGNDVFIVGTYGAIWHYDGSEWTKMESPTYENLTGVFGTCPSDVFAVGLEGTIIHYDGTAWSLMDSPTTSHLLDVWGVYTGVEYPFNKIWGSSSGNIFLVSTGRKVYLYKGSSFHGLPQLTEKLIHGVWGPQHAPSQVFAVGSEGVFLHYTRTKPQCKKK
jgi:hypothetical protein